MTVTGTLCSASWTSVRVYSVLNSQQSFLLPWGLDIIPSGGADALSEVFLRFNPHRWDQVRTRRGDRSRRCPQAQKEAFQKISREIRTHAALGGREDTLEVPPPRDRHRHRSITGHEGSEARGQAPQNQTIDPADEAGDQGAEAKTRRNQRHPARHLLSHTRSALDSNTADRPPGS